MTTFTNFTASAASDAFVACGMNPARLGGRKAGQTTNAAGGENAP